MENIDELREQQRIADRAAAAPYIEYPRSPAWYPAAMGLWGFLATMVMARRDNPEVVRIGGEVVLLLAAFGLIWWQRRIRGTWPTGRAPAEIRRAMLWFVVGAAMVIAAVLGARVWLGVWVAAVFAFVVVTAGVGWYEVAYARAAQRVRDRLA